MTGPTPQRAGPTQNLGTGQPLRGAQTQPGNQGGNQGGNQNRPGFRQGVRVGIRTSQNFLNRTPKASGVGRAVTGITNRVPRAQAQLTWEPDPRSVLFVGTSLIVANILVQGGIGPLWDSIWNLDNTKHSPPTYPTSRGVFGEFLFIFVLYVLASLSDTLARAILVFLGGIWFIFLLFYGPKIVTFFNGK